MEYGQIKLRLVLLDQQDTTLDDKYYDYTQYLQVGAAHTLNLDDTLDRIVLNLYGLPFRHELSPTSLFRLYVSQEQTDDEDNTFTYEETFDFALEQDDVEQPDLADDSFFNHKLSLINPAIIAQQRPVDNISVTYKLQNVVTQSQSVDTTSKVNIDVINANYENGTGVYLPSGTRKFRVDYSSLAPWDPPHVCYDGYAYYWVQPDITYPAGVLSESNRATATYSETFTDIENLYQNILYDPLDDTITFDTPMLAYMYGEEGTREYKFGGYIPVDITIYDTDLSTQVTAPAIELTAYPSRYIKDNNDIVESYIYEDDNNATGNHYITDYEGRTFSQYNVLISKGISADDVIVNNEVKNRTISLQTQPNHSYTFLFTQHKLQSRNPVVEARETTDDSGGFNPSGFRVKRLNENIDCYMQFTFNVYDPNDILENLFKQAEQTDAYYLFQKAQLSASPTQKSLGKPYYNTSLPFVVSDADRDLLKKTKIIESDFIGKNLWEIFTEIGKYIHAKPYITIKTYDLYETSMTNKFQVNFLKYGSPEINTKETTTNSIFNSKFAQEYISSLTSYVENYFNLGSEVTEYLHTSSESEDGLVYNDVVKLITKYPILEIIKLYAYDSNGVEKDITKYLFEYNIYKCLEYGNTPPSKTFGIYYHLGSKMIEGMQFVKPMPTGVECAYSMKNILGRAFGILNPDNIQINEYYFKLVYRTKDNVRVDMTRPDLRKYLLNTDMDRYPIHSQFNQQQDKLVNSDLLGLNAYGKLIRTGNTTYSMSNWCDDISKLMKHGDLYNINNQLYYVSKTTRIYYSDHVEEQVELTQDFNRLSQIIGIPSEPRFYEISERSIVNRDVSFNEYIKIDLADNVDYTLYQLRGFKQNALKEMFYSPQQTKQVLTFFKGDRDKAYDVDSNSDLYITLSPINTFYSKTTYTLEWDMEDNFSAGEQIIDTQETLQWSLNLFSLLNNINNNGSVPNQAYKTRNPVRYVDVYGRADLVDFLILKDMPTLNGTIDRDFIEQIPMINESDLINLGFYDNIFGGTATQYDEPLDTSTNVTTITNAMNRYKSHTNGYILAKDNREKISFNCNIQLLSNTDRIVFGNKMWKQDYTNGFHIVFLNTELNKFSADSISADNVIYASSVLTNNQVLTFVDKIGYIDGSTYFSNLTDEEKALVKAFAVVREIDGFTDTYEFIIGANVDETMTMELVFSNYSNDEALTNRKQIEKYL